MEKAAQRDNLILSRQLSHTGLVQPFPLPMLPSLRTSTKHLANSAQPLFFLRRPHSRLWQRNITDYRAKYASQLGKVAQQ